MIPASIRTKNPSAMWPGSISKRFGSTEYETLHDSQNNKIAIFPTVEQGAAAQFALWASKGYLGLTLRNAIYKWSGHNSATAYAKSLADHIPGLSLDTVITIPFLRSDSGWKFMKLQAQWEAGRVYPMTDAQWQAAQKLAFGDTPAAAPAPSTKPAADTSKKPETAPQSLLWIIINFILSLFKK
jgi:hypothetical protein